MTAEELRAWCAEIGQVFRKYEHELPTEMSDDRDAALIEYAIRVLANPRIEGTTRIVERINHRREVSA